MVRDPIKRILSHWVHAKGAGYETRDLDENTLPDLDADGNICAITVEHASKRADIPKFSYEQVAP